MPSKRLFCCAVGTALLGAAVTARAIVVEETEGFGLTAVPFGSMSFSFQQFPNSLGKLLTIVFTLDATVNAEVEVFNSNLTMENYTGASGTVSMALAGPAGLTLSTSTQFGNYSGPVPAGTLVVAGSGTASAFKMQLLTGGGALTPYRGTGTFTLDLSAIDSFSGAPNSGVFFGGSASVMDPPAAGVTVTFDYTPRGVPDSGMTLALLGVALAGVALVRQRTASV